MPRLFHVTSRRNRASIERYGLDWARIGHEPGAYQSSLTITLDDGRVLREAEAREWMQRRSSGKQ